MAAKLFMATKPFTEGVFLFLIHTVKTTVIQHILSLWYTHLSN